MRKMNRRMHVHMTDEQYAAFRKAYENTSDSSLGAYARKLLLGKPVRMYYRDVSFDAFTEAGVQLNKDLERLCGMPGMREEVLAQVLETAGAIRTLLIQIDENVRENKSNKRRPRHAGV